MNHTPHRKHRAAHIGVPARTSRHSRSLRRVPRREPVGAFEGGPANPASDPGAGHLQSHRADPAPDNTVGNPQTVPTPVAQPPASLRVLLAEDDSMVAKSTVAVLRRLGYSVTHAFDGASAWKSLQAQVNAFDVLLLDVVMPRMSGSDLAYRARSAGFTGPIVLISGLVTQIDPDALALLGIRHFLTKPFTPADLDRALRDVDL